MRSYEKALKTIIVECQKTTSRNPLSSKDINCSESDILSLEDKGLIRITRYIHGDMRIDLTPSGKTYFEDLHYSRRQRWIDRLVGFLSGVSVTVVATLIVKQILGA